MSEITIRPLRVDDIEVLQEIDRLGHGIEWSHAHFLDQIERPIFVHLVAVDAVGEILGHAATWRQGDVLRVTNVAVAESAAGRGVATALLVELLSDPGDVVQIRLETRLQNVKALRLYSTFGFVPAGVERDFYPPSDVFGTSTSAIVMIVVDPQSPEWQNRIAELAARQETLT